MRTDKFSAHVSDSQPIGMADQQIVILEHSLGHPSLFMSPKKYPSYDVLIIILRLKTLMAL